MFCIATQRKSRFFKLPVLAGCLTLLIFLQISYLHAQTTQNTTPAESIDSGFRQMYNLDFASAHQTFEIWQQLHPSDPLGPAANAAAYLFAEFERLHILEIELFTNTGKEGLKDRRKGTPNSGVKTAFLNELNKADRIAKEILVQSPKDRDALFARVLSDGLRGDYAALIEDRNGEGLDYLKSSRVNAEKLVAIDPDYYDAYLSIGLENYLLGLRSAPVRFFLKMSGAKTNKDLGIANLKITAENGRYLAPYARLLLAIAALRNKDKATAKNLLTGLVREFPENRLYRSELARLQG